MVVIEGLRVAKATSFPVFKTSTSMVAVEGVNAGCKTAVGSVTGQVDAYGSRVSKLDFNAIAVYSVVLGLPGAGVAVTVTRSARLPVPRTTSAYERPP